MNQPIQRTASGESLVDLLANSSGFVPEPFLQSPDKGAYLAAVHDTYVRDAYYSRYMGYHVIHELVARVGSHEADLKSKDAMAARGYFLARQKVEDSIRRILDGENSGRVVAQDHRVWYRELFAPSVDAKLLKPSDLPGGGHQVFIRNDAHVPPTKEAVRDMMPPLFEFLEAEPRAAARAVLGHLIFVCTHAYMDGNGRIGRFLMNAVLTSGGALARRPEYMQAPKDGLNKR